jgi:hypothetical protein
MTPKQLYILEKLGLDINKPEEEIFESIINLADYLYKELEIDERERFMREIKRLKNPTN